jgi:DME family drug/metabolite transporter
MSAATPALTRAQQRGAPRTGLAWLVASGLLWGTGGLTGRLLGQATGLPAMSVACYRLTVGGALIIAFLTLTGRRWPSGRAAWTRIAVIGLLAALFQGCYFTAVALTSVSLATLLTIGSAPVMVLVADQVTGRRRIDRLAAGTTGLSLAGLALLVGLPNGGLSESTVLLSAGLALLSAAGFAAVTVVSSRPVPGLDDLTVTGFAFAAGGLVLLPAAVVAGGLEFRPGPVALGLLAVLATGPTAVAYTLYFRGLRTAAASTAALLSLLEPLTGTILAAVVLGDRLGAAGIAGAAILAAAVALTALTRR